MVVTPSTLMQTYTVVLHQAEEGGFWGEVLELPGCVSQGEIIGEFRENIREAIVGTESEQPKLEIQPEPTLAEKDHFQFVVQEPYETLMTVSEANDTWTAAS